MQISLALDPKSYSTFITTLRTQDKTSQARTKIEAQIADEKKVLRSYYLTSPNFELTAFKIPPGVDTDLQDYNHVLPPGPVNIETVKQAFSSPHVNRMDANLSTICVFMSEAARSAMVFNACMKVLRGTNKKMDLNQFNLLFTNYKKTAQLVGYVEPGVAFKYTSRWKPLVREDYAHYFSVKEYTGDRKTALATLDQLADF